MAFGAFVGTRSAARSASSRRFAVFSYPVADEAPIDEYRAMFPDELYLAGCKTYRRGVDLPQPPIEEKCGRVTISRAEQGNVSRCRPHRCS